jgi:hypothetical protein
MVLFKPRAEHFLSFVNKGPESERGCSVNKALKRYHRERSDSGASLSKLMEEKELWRSLRMDPVNFSRRILESPSPSHPSHESERQNLILWQAAEWRGLMAYWLT